MFSGFVWHHPHSADGPPSPRYMSLKISLSSTCVPTTLTMTINTVAKHEAFYEDQKVALIKSYCCLPEDFDIS